MGLFNKLKSVIGIQEPLKSSEFQTLFDECVAEVSKDSSYFYVVNFSSLTPYNQVIKKWDDEKKGAFIVFLITIQYSNFKAYRKGLKKESKDFQMANQMLPALFRSKMKLSESTLVAIYTTYQKGIPSSGYPTIYLWPLLDFLSK
jgi:hypothetical protein